jgi:hypothetical protein
MADLVVGPVAVVVGRGKGGGVGDVQVDTGLVARHQVGREGNDGVGQGRVVVDRVAQVAAAAGTPRVGGFQRIRHVVELHRAGIVEHQHDVGLDVRGAAVGQRRGRDVGAGGERLLADGGEEGRRAEYTGDEFGKQFLVHGWLPKKA